MNRLMLDGLRVLAVSYAYPPYLESGGPSESVRSMTEGLAGLGARVTILTPNRFGRTKRTVVHAGNPDVVYLSTWSRHRATTLNPGVVSYSLRHLRRFDVVHIWGFYDLLGPAVAWFCRRWRVPYVLEPIGMHRPIVRSFWKKRAFHLLAGRRLAAAAFRVVAASPQERAELIEDGVRAEKVAVRRVGVDPRAFDPLPPPGAFRSRHGIPPDAPVTIFLGRITPKKRPDLLLEAFAALPGPQGFLVFAGPDEDGLQRRLEESAGKRGLKDRVLFVGPTYGREKVEALRDADVFVLPSENENFGVAAVEAAACGTPAIVTDRCGVAEHIRGRAGLVVGLEHEQIRDALRSLLGDAGLRERYGSEGPALARELSWEVPVAEMAQLYLEAVQR